MDISGVAIPSAVPEVAQEPPRDAQLQRAVPESAESSSQDNNTAPDSRNQRDPDSTLGHHVDERA